MCTHFRLWTKSVALYFTVMFYFYYLFLFQVEMKSEKLCIVCYDREPHAFYFPCGHTSCLACALHLQANGGKCPHCRMNITKVKSIFNDFNDWLRQFKVNNRTQGDFYQNVSFWMFVKTRCARRDSTMTDDTQSRENDITTATGRYEPVSVSNIFTLFHANTWCGFFSQTLELHQWTAVFFL